MRVREDVRVIVDVHGGHAHWRAGRDRPRFVLQAPVGEDAREAVGDAVEDAEGLVHDRDKVGHLLELAERGRRRGVWEFFSKLGH